MKAICINLHNEVKKFEDTSLEMKKFGIETERFITYKLKDVPRIKRKEVPYDSKVHNILDSHLKSMNKQIKCSDEMFIFLEDDIIVIRDVDLNVLINNAPSDWDVIYLGGSNHHYLPEIIDDIFYKCKFSFNCHAMVIKTAFVPKIIEQLQKRKWENDVIYAQMQEDGIGNWYGVVDDIIIQHGKYADIKIAAYPVAYERIKDLLPMLGDVKLRRVTEPIGSYYK